MVRVGASVGIRDRVSTAQFIGLCESTVDFITLSKDTPSIWTPLY